MRTMTSNILLLVFMALPFLINQNGTEGLDILRAVASNGKDGIIMAGMTDGSWVDKGVVENLDFAAILLDVEAMPGPSPSPTTSSPTWCPTQSPTMSNHTRSRTPLHATSSPTRFTTRSTSSPTKTPTEYEKKSLSTALIAGAAAGGVAVVAIVIILVVCWRRRAAMQNVQECRIPHLHQEARLPATTREGTDTPRSPNGDAIFDPLPGCHAKEPESVESKAIDCMGEEDSGGDADMIQGLNGKVTYLVPMSSTAEDTSEPKNSATSELLPPFHPRDDSVHGDVATARVTKMPSANRASSERTGMLTYSEILYVAEAVIETANAVASSSVPIVCEAATLIAALVRLAVECKNNDGAAEWRIRWCRSILAILGQASKILRKDEDGAIGAAERPLLEDVYDSVSNLVGIIQTYEAKNKLLKLFASSIFKRRQDEAEAIINHAISRLQLGLHVETRCKIAAIAQDVHEGLKNMKGLDSDYAARALTESRRAKRQRRMQQLEIPEHQVTLTDVLLGKGGFSNVFLADFSGINAAAKVIQVENEQPRSAGQSDGVCADVECMVRPTDEQAIQRRLFKCELETMTRLKSSHTVHVYGAITTRPDRFVLVMELMTGGDLRTLLRQAEAPLPRDRARGILNDICFGMAFLHSKGAIHGDLKSANVLFDGCGTAKIADFGTAKWVQHGVSTGLVTTYVGSKVTNSTHMSIPWASPEVLDDDPASFKSDVYSFGIIAWEIASRQMPWAGLNARMIFMRVVLAGARPEMPNDATEEIEDVIRSCWEADPTTRPNFSDIVDKMKSWTN